MFTQPASLIPFDVHFQLGLLCKACRNTLLDLCSAWLNCIGPRWCWVGLVIKAAGCRPTRFLFRHNRSVWCWILITLQFKPEDYCQIYTQQQTRRCVLMLILLELFSIFWTHKVHYKLQQSTLQNFHDGGLLSMVFYPYTPLVGWGGDTPPQELHPLGAFNASILASSVPAALGTGPPMG